MENKGGYYLSGGIFFSLLLEAKGKRPSPRELRNGKKKCEITNKNMLEGLIQLFCPSFEQPSYGTTFEGDTSDYRSCKASDGQNLPFDDEAEIKDFDKRVKNSYTSVLVEMNDYIGTFLYFKSDDQMRWLINRLLIVIEKDRSISPETVFYLSEEPIPKSELLSVPRYCLANLLLAVWHFIVVNRPDNKLGRDTYTTFYTRANENNAKWKFNDYFGRSYPRSFTFDVLAKPECNNEETPAEESQPVEPEVIAEPREEECEASYTAPKTDKQVLAQFHVEAKDHGIAVGQVLGNLVIGNRSDKDE